VQHNQAVRVVDEHRVLVPRVVHLIV
jgi:hypothetical protein